MRKAHYLIFLFLIINIIACNKKHSGDKVLAKVYDKYLYLEDIRTLVPAGTNAKDSAIKVNNYIDLWAKKQLLIIAAQENLTEEQQDFERKVEDYRSSLLIYMYKQKIIEQKLDTIVTNKDIETYYNTHQPEFKLTSNAVKCLYVKVLKSLPEVPKVKLWYRSSSKSDSLELEKFGKKYATKYSYFNNDWVSFGDILKEFHSNVQDQKEFLLSRTTIEAQDNEYYYFVNIKAYKLKGELTPLVFVKENIRSIILNKRKVMLIEELEKNIYQNALNKNKLEIINEN